MRADRHFQHHLFAVGTGAVLAHAIGATLGFEMLLIAIVDEGVEPVDGLDNDVAAFAAVAAVRSSELDEFLSPKGDAAVAARAGRNIDLRFIEEFHGLVISHCTVIRERPPIGQQRPHPAQGIRMSLNSLFCREGRDQPAARTGEA